MGLTDHERRELDQIEQQLAEDDPKLAARLTRPGARLVLTRKAWVVIATLATYVAGLVVMIIGVTLSSAAVVVLGAVLVAAVFADVTRRSLRSVRSSWHER